MTSEAVPMSRAFHFLLRGPHLRRLVPIVAVAGALGVMAPAAGAAPISYTATDPATDGTGSKSYDLVSAAVTYDPAAGSATATIETAVPLVTGGAIQTFLGRRVGEDCTTPADTEAILGIAFSSLGGVEISAWLLSQPEGTAGQPTTTKSGSKITIVIAPDPALLNQTWDCIRVETYEEGTGADSSAALSDTMVGFVGTAGTTPPPGGGSTTPPTDTKRAPIIVITELPDADKDGTPDTSDACTTVPGAAKNGCPTVAAAMEFRLGAKRVVVDRLVPRTAAKCPPRVAVIVTSKGKRIGKGVFTVDQYGSFCRVNGIVALKTKGKTKVRVVAKGTGMASIARSVKR